MIGYGSCDRGQGHTVLECLTQIHLGTVRKQFLARTVSKDTA